MRVSGRAWLAIGIGWTALALFLAASNALTYRALGDPANWSLAITRSLSDWWLWALLTPVVWWLARRYPVEGPRRGRHLAVHIGVGLLVAGLKTVASRAVFAWVTGIWSYLLVSTVAMQLVVYGCLVTAAHGVEYYRRSRERDQLAARLSDARVQVLTMQLQPHFLFNTLNTIAELVHEDPVAADGMIVGLSDLLRRTLELETARSIPLNEEVRLLDKYLAIQRMRHGARLHVDVRIDDGVRGAEVPVLLLQPLVENAVRHALARGTGAGRISIAAWRDAHRLRIEVGDNGETPAADNAGSRTGLGLSNTRARIEALYGHGCGLDLEPRPGGTRVRLDLPFRLPEGTS